MTPVIRCTSDPGHGVWPAASSFAHRATWTLLLAHLIVGGLTFAGCVSSSDELRPETSETPSPVTADGWRQPKDPDRYYAVMASAAASAYPARFERTTMEMHGTTRLRVDPDFVMRYDVTDPARVTIYVDASRLDTVRIIIAFRGTVHPTVSSPLSNWTDIGTDISSQFLKTRHVNPLIPPGTLAIGPEGRAGAGWETRWHNVAKVQEFKDFMRDIAMESLRPRHMEVNVVGHSLGGVVAELAGLDIEEYLLLNGQDYEVNVIAFNPPKLGSQDLVNEYRRRLRVLPDLFRISVFTREGDIVDDVPFDHLGIAVGYFHQVINNVAYDNLTPLCSPYMFGGQDNPLAVGAEGEVKELPYAPRLHVTKPFSYGSHSIDDWVGDPNKDVRYRQVFAPRTNPNGFRCMFAPESLGQTGRLVGGNLPPQPLLNCSVYATMKWPVDCNPSPPAGANPRDEL